MAERSYNGRQLLTNLNADFENSPGGVATTTSDRWIDGTAGGAATNAGGYGWRVGGSLSFSASFDSTEKHSGSHSIKLSTLATASQLSIGQGSFSGGLYIPVKPLATYTIKGWMKTRYVSGDATNGAALALITFKPDGVNAIDTKVWSGYVKTTTDWTEYSLTFTTKVNERYICFNNRIYGHQGTATLIMDAWFDDISLTEVLPARTPATSRATATNRVAVRDMGTALYNGDVTANALDISVQPTTVSYWLRYKSALGHNDFAFFTSTATDSLRLNIEVGTGKLFTWKVRADGTGALGYKTTKRLNAKEWYHVAFTYDPTTGVTEIYIDGVKDGSGGDTTYLCRATNNLQCYMQTNGASTKDDLRIWNRALSATEIQNLYLYNDVPRDGLVAEYLFNEASGTTAIDSSGNGNDGTITGATYTTDTPLRPRTSV